METDGGGACETVAYDDAHGAVVASAADTVWLAALSEQLVLPNYCNMQT